MILSHLIEGVIANTKINFIDGEIKEVKDDGNRKDINKINPKLYRAAVVTFHITSKNDIKPSYSSSENEVSSISKEFMTDSKTENRLINEISSSRTEDINDVYTHDNEYLYFSEVCDKNQSMVYKHIIDKVRYFDPAFHSITPEGFNARLTFLHQCTRQGPTSSVKKGSGNGYLEYAGNLSFGRAPYCVLRIGDFFNTKICIDSISIQYDNSGVQWDLNPEGVGVQPMYANVSLNFKFVGGQDISGPIERLQNAVSSNYYANASVYDNHADYDNKRFNFDTGEYYK